MKKKLETKPMVQKDEVTNEDTEGRDLLLSHKDAQAGSPIKSLCGEEDPGSALEFLVTRDPDK